jgi:PQQ-like domain
MQIPPQPVDETTIIVKLEWHYGQGFFFVDTFNRRLSALRSAIPFKPPLAVLTSPERGTRLAVLGPELEVSRMEWNWQVLMLDIGGRSIWSHQVHAQPLRLTPGIGDTLIFAASPSRKRWDDYHKWYNLADETFVRCLEPDGSVRWTWYAPGPISHLPAVGTTGTVYVASEGRLWALAPDVVDQTLSKTAVRP